MIQNVIGATLLIHLVTFIVGVITFIIGVVRKDFLMRTACSVSLMAASLCGFILEAYKDNTFWVVFWMVVFFVNLGSARMHYSFWVMQKTIEQRAREVFENLDKDTKKQKEENETDNS